MPNMSHCRFTNTLDDLKDCYDHIDDEDLSVEECKAKHKLLLLAIEISIDYCGVDCVGILKEYEAGTKGDC